MLKNYQQQVNGNPHSKSHSNFVITGSQLSQSKKNEWQWITQKRITSFNANDESYKNKRNILSSLQEKEKKEDTFRLRKGFSIKSRKNMISTSNSTSSLRKMRPYTYVNQNRQSNVQKEYNQPNININEQQIFQKMHIGKKNNQKVIAVLSVKRFGLRFKVNHTFVNYCLCNKKTHNHDFRLLSSEIKSSIKDFNKRSDQELYYFHLNGEPINNFQENIKSNEFVIVVDSSPKLNLTFNLQQKILDVTRQIQMSVVKFYQYFKENKQSQKSQEIDDDESQIYDYQVIKNPKQYAFKMSQNPEFRIKTAKVAKNNLLDWYQQKYKQSKELGGQTSDKNPLFQSNSHYPLELKNPKLLHDANIKVQKFGKTINKHKFITKPLDMMMQDIQKQDKNSKTIFAKDYEPPYTKKDILTKMDKKNGLLAVQNIPYLIQKYGINRYEIHKLYNLYKSLEKISAMRKISNENMYQIMQNGIDRETFDEGLKGLDMNPGDELIKNICHFDDFISWQEFIKIISISLRKTPQQKLTAILQGIMSQNQTCLSRHQISMMIGNSINKLFDNQERQLKEYFTNVAMNVFDPQNTGKVEIQDFKQKVLSKEESTQSMVSFLLLNA